MLSFSLKPSCRLVILLFLAHVASFAVIGIIDGAIWIKVFVCLSIFLSGVFYLLQALLKLPGSVVSVLLKANGLIEVTKRNQTIVTGSQLPGSFVHPWCVVIMWRPETARFSRAILIFSDSLAEESFRELSVWLRWRRLKNSEMLS